MRDERGDLLQGDHRQGWDRIPPGADQAEEGKRGDGCKVEEGKTDLQHRLDCALDTSESPCDNWVTLWQLR